MISLSELRRVSARLGLGLAQAYWVSDLADQVKPSLLSPWEQVVTELRPLLANLLQGKIRDLP